jgi:hypothetical protein
MDATVIREERYLVDIGAEQFVLRVQEEISGCAFWPGKFRVQIPGTQDRRLTTVYGATALEAVENAILHLRGHATACLALAPHRSVSERN